MPLVLAGHDFQLLAERLIGHYHRDVADLGRQAALGLAGIAEPCKQLILLSFAGAFEVYEHCMERISDLVPQAHGMFPSS